MPVPRKYTEKEKDGRRVSSAVVREAVKHLEGFHTLTSTRRLKASLPCIAGRLLGDGKGEEFLSLILFISHFLQIFFVLPFFPSFLWLRKYHQQKRLLLSRPLAGQFCAREEGGDSRRVIHGQHSFSRPSFFF